MKNWIKHGLYSVGIILVIIALYSALTMIESYSFIKTFTANFSIPGTVIMFPLILALYGRSGIINVIIHSLVTLISVGVYFLLGVIILTKSKYQIYQIIKFVVLSYIIMDFLYFRMQMPVVLVIILEILLFIKLFPITKYIEGNIIKFYPKYSNLNIWIKRLILFIFYILIYVILKFLIVNVIMIKILNVRLVA